jgi:archaellin
MKPTYFMKQILLFTAIIILAIFSSCTSDLERTNKEIKGIWVLESVQFTDSTGRLKIISDLDVTITLSDSKESIEVNDSGFQIIDGDTLFFDYYVSLYTCCFYYREKDFSTMPMDVLSNQCFTYNQIDKNSFELYAENEYDFVKKEKMSQVSYLYTKLRK